MFERIMNTLFPPKLTELELAVKKILSLNRFGTTGLSEVDPVNRNFFVLGKIKVTHSGVGSLDSISILFGRKQEDVVIKYKDEVVYYFNHPNEVEIIRNAVIQAYNNIQTKNQQNELKDFDAL